MNRIAFTSRFFVFIATLLFALASAIPVDCSAQLVLNEIMAAPSIDWDGDGTYSYRDDEWVEVYNASASAISLDGYRLADADTSWRFGFSGVLPAGGHLVVYGSHSYLWERANGYGAYGLSLSNTGDTVRLWKFAGSDSFQTDAYTYGKNEAGSNRSVGRKPSGAAEWHIFDSLNPYTGTEPPLGTGCPPTPGAANGCATDVEPSRWGSIKALFK